MSEVILILILIPMLILIPIPTPFLQCLCREPLDNADNTRKEATDRPGRGVWNEGLEW